MNDRKKTLDVILKEQEKNGPDAPKLSILIPKTITQDQGLIDLVTPEPQPNGVMSFNGEVEESNGSAISNDTTNVNTQETNEVMSSAEVPESVRCTACNKNLRLKKKKICKHPRLNVLLCKSCLKFINSNDFKRDEMGVEEFCTWCGDGGNLVCCDYCEKAYCKHCIKRNLGKAFLKYLLEAGDDLKWKCFSCDKKQIFPYIEECSNVMKHMSELHMQESTIDVNKTHVSGLSQKERLQRMNEVSKKVDDAPNTHVGMKSSFTAVEIGSNPEESNINEQDQLEKTSITTPNDSSISKEISEGEPKKIVEETKEKEVKKKKQTVVVLSSSEEDSEEEIVVVSKSGKKTVLNKSLLMAAQALLKNKNLDKIREASQSDSDFSSTKTKSERERGKPKNTDVRKRAKKGLGNFMRLSLNTNKKKKSDSEEINESSMSSSDSDTPPERSDSSDDSSDDENSKKKRKHPRKNSLKSKVAARKEREIIDGVVFDDEQPGPSGIRPKNKMQKLREQSKKKQVSDSSDEEFIPDIQSLQEHRKEENKKIISKINSPDLDTMPVSTDSPKSKKIMSPFKNVQKSPCEQEDISTAKDDNSVIVNDNEDNTLATLTAEENSESSNTVSCNDSLTNTQDCEQTSIDEESVNKTENVLQCTVTIQKLSDIPQKSDSEDCSGSLLSPQASDITEFNADSTVDVDIPDEEKEENDENKEKEVDDESNEKNVDGEDEDEEEEDEGEEKQLEDEDDQENENTSSDNNEKVSEKEAKIDDESADEDTQPVEKQQLRRSKRKQDNTSGDDSEVQETTETVKSKKRKKKENIDKSGSSEDTETAPAKKSKHKKSKSASADVNDESVEEATKNRKSKRLQKKESIDVSSDNGKEVSSTSKKEKKKRKDRVDVSSGDSDVQISRPTRKSKSSKRRRKRARLNSNGSSAVSSSSSESDVEQHADTVSSDSSSDGSIIITKKKAPTKKKGKVKSKKKNSDDDNDDSDDQSKTPTKGRRKIRKILKDSQLTEETKRARELEEQRRNRLLQRTKAERLDIAKVLEVSDGDFILERNEKKEPLIYVDVDINKHLKPHQRNGIKFMYDCTIESIKNYRKGEEGGGCLLAHCMGLGKTLQIVSFVHTCYKNKSIKMKRFLVVAPLNTVLNWEQEFEKWLNVDERMDVFVLSYCTNGNKERMRMIRDWFENGGVMILGYEMYRNLVNFTYIKSKKMKEDIKKFLVDPGPELVVCDEGHVLRNSMSAISIAMNNIKTKRRIVLTGTPLQNNLPEYHVMVDFVKPKLLGTKKEFLNRFVNPINNGRCSNSTPRDVRVMKQRCHVLYQMLSGCVQRQDYSVLTPFLPPKREYTIMVRLTEKQIEMYNHYLNEFVYQGPMNNFKGNSLFSDFHCLSRIWSHPWSLHLERIRQYARNRFKDEMDEFIDDEDDEETSESDGDNDKKPWNEDTSSEEETDRKRRNRRRKVVSSDSDDKSKSEEESEKEEVQAQRATRSSRRQTRAAIKEGKTSKNKNKPANIQSDDDDDDVTEVKPEKEVGALRSGINFKDGSLNPEPEQALPEYGKEWYDEFLKEEDEHNVEHSGKLVLMLDIIANAEVVKDKVLVFTQSLASLDLIESALGGGEINGNQINWCHGIDYFRMDGSTSINKRKRWSDIFNDPDNERCRLFLISTKAGSLGINMVAANRVIIFDCSWNPSHDVQSVFRVYRFGQEKPVYVYRLIAQGTMEEKIYDRQITKLAVASRVVDEMQIERHFTDEEIRELYIFKPDTSDNAETPQLPKDPVLAEVLQRQHPKYIVRYHEHDLLLENVAEEEMTEEEKKTAWKSYEDEKEMAARRVEYRTMAVQNIQNNFQTMYDQQQQLVNSRLLNMPTIRVATPVGAVAATNSSVQPRYIVRLPNGTHQMMSHAPTGRELSTMQISEQQFRILNTGSLGNTNTNTVQRTSAPNVARVVNSYPGFPQSMQSNANNSQNQTYHNVRFTTNTGAPIRVQYPSNSNPGYHSNSNPSAQQQVRPNTNGQI